MLNPHDTLSDRVEKPNNKINITSFTINSRNANYLSKQEDSEKTEAKLSDDMGNMV